MAEESRPKFFLINDYFWLLFGVLIFMPFEVIYDGLYLAYLQIVILFLVSKRQSRIKLLLLIFYSISVLASVLFGSDPQLTSLVNPILTGLALIIILDDRHKISMIKRGVYLCAFGTAIYLLFLAQQKDIDNIFLLMRSRDWGKEEIPYFGNGLAMLFSAAMLLAFREKKLLLLMVFFVGGVLTTSRIPILFFIFLSILSIGRRLKFSKKFPTVFVILFLGLGSTFAGFSFLENYQEQFQELYRRMSTTEDRVEVYELSLDQFYANPILGGGSKKLDFYDHAHNSYIQILYKYGMITFIFWVSLLYLTFFKNLNYLKNIDFFLLFLICSMAQIGLQNPNLILMLLICRKVLSDNSFNIMNRLNSRAISV